MEISILHISDAHFKESNNHIHSKSNKIFDAIKNEILGHSFLFIIFSGDIAFSGKEEEYSEAKKFLKTIESMLIEYNDSLIIHYIFAPGNHDCDFSENTDIRDLLLPTLVNDISKATHAIIDSTCVNIQQSYFNFINELETAKNLVSTSTKIFRQHRFQVNDVSQIIFNSYNLAWASNKHEKQANLCFPVHLINQSEIQTDSANIVISLFHHPIHWLNHENIRPFSKMINSSSTIVLTGHEHTYSATKVTSLDNNKSAEFIEAGCLQTFSDITSSTFNLIKVNFVSKEHSTLQFSFNHSLYEKKQQIDYHPLCLSKQTYFELKSYYSNMINTMELKITHPTKNNLCLDDIFIYPLLKTIITNKTSNKKNIYTEISSESFQNIDKINHLIIYGDETAGKTSLARIIQLRHQILNNLVIIVDGSDITNETYESSKIKNLIYKAFKEQYQINNETKNLYSQFDKNQTIIIIDNFDDAKINSEYKANFINNLKQLQYPHLILFAHDAIKLEATTESSLTESLRNFEHYQIKDFGYRLRDQLIKRWIILGQEQTISQTELIYLTRTKADIINKILGYNIVPSYPLYILTLLQAMEINESHSLSKSSYGHYYQYLIMQSLTRNKPLEPKHLNTVTTFTAELAYKIFLEKNHIFSYEDLKDFLDKYCANKKYTPDFDILQHLISSGIINEYEGYYKFSHNYIYYYFVATYFSDNSENFETQSILLKMTKRLYRTEFANIIMFVLHLSPKASILQTLLEESKSVFQRISSFQFLPDEIEHINKLIQTDLNIKLKNKSLQEYREEEITHKEKSHSIEEKQTLNHENVDFNEEIKPLDMFATLNLALKIIDLLGEIIKNYSGALQGDIKVSIIEEVYLLGLRSMKKILSFFEDNHETLMRELEEIIAKKHASTQHEIAEITAHTIYHLVLSVSYGLIIRIAKSVASKDLKEIYQELLDNNKDNISFELIDIAIKLRFKNGLSIKDIEKLHKKLDSQKNKLADASLKKIVLEHFYMYELPYDIQQSVCHRIGIDTDKSKSEFLKRLS